MSEKRRKTRSGQRRRSWRKAAAKRAVRRRSITTGTGSPRDIVRAATERIPTGPALFPPLCAIGRLRRRRAVTGRPASRAPGRLCTAGGETVARATTRGELASCFCTVRSFALKCANKSCQQHVFAETVMVSQT